ncbi:uncharacterized protein LY89DRAFT_578607 [Mollisia scopiformis]|uniref:N-acetyltransferase domain-containing protein n=1 Tax=Mollisia scopiformis TaxID=149040 RepID=A0A194XKB8_MOLSC|nr:uncharacterized protein LY89DRAFT_578607 [Mollisia scopiformis]KUJ20586.1 hypothetical protein LY89DRAFT_578607 [Mollisia scopiformis]
MGNLKLLPCEPADAAEILAGQIAAFSNPHEPFFFVLFPEDEEREKAVKRTLDWWLGDKTARYMKVVDEERAIISAAKWCIYEEQLTEEQMNESLHVDWHKSPDTNAWAEYLIHEIHSRRLQRTKGARCCVLDMMSTHPDHQRCGAGSMLVEWGIKIADSMGVESFIEGTIAAKHLYESCGFKAVPDDWLFVPVAEKWKDRPEIKYFFYERAATGS